MKTIRDRPWGDPPTAEPCGCHFKEAGVHSASGRRDEADRPLLPLDAWGTRETVQGPNKLRVILRIDPQISPKGPRRPRKIHIDGAPEKPFWFKEHACYFLPGDFLFHPEPALGDAGSIQVPGQEGALQCLCQGAQRERKRHELKGTSISRRMNSEEAQPGIEGCQCNQHAARRAEFCPEPHEGRIPQDSGQIQHSITRRRALLAPAWTGLKLFPRGR